MRFAGALLWVAVVEICMAGVLMVTLIVMTAATARAFCLEPQPIRVCAEFFKADEVFTGTVISDNYMPNGLPDSDDGQPGWHYRLKVLKTYRGSPHSVRDIYTENSSGRFPLDRGTSYLLFAYKTDSISRIYDCTNSIELTRAGDKLAEINRLITAQGSGSGGDIWGRVIQQSGGAALAGVQVTALRGKSIYQTHSELDGSFHIRVPAGKYRVTASSAKWNVSGLDVSFDQPSQVTIHPGGCAQIQFGAFAK